MWLQEKNKIKESASQFNRGLSSVWEMHPRQSPDTAITVYLQLYRLSSRSIMWFNTRYFEIVRGATLIRSLAGEEFLLMVIEK